MHSVDVYGVDHSPWVQAVLLGLHEAEIPHTVTAAPPLDVFLRSGIMMPAAKIDGGSWTLESADILHNVGFDAISDEQMTLVRRAWQGVNHRVDSTALFWGSFSLTGDQNPSTLRRTWNNFVRSFVTLYFFCLISTVNLRYRPRDPDNFGDQFLAFEKMLKASAEPYLCGQKPDSLDFLLFGIIQCHCSIYVPPIAALQTDPRLETLRCWISTMQARFKDYDRLYSGMYFAPHTAPPTPASGGQRMAFWLGAAFMTAAFPVTLPLAAYLAIRSRKGANT
jgi:hypothetical protein